MKGKRLSRYVHMFCFLLFGVASFFLSVCRTVYAIEKHPDRYNSLCNVVAQSGASCVKPILGSALNVSATELPDVEYIVVDPTCSGSGQLKMFFHFAFKIMLQFNMKVIVAPRYDQS